MSIFHWPLRLLWLCPLFPYTTLFRSLHLRDQGRLGVLGDHEARIDSGVLRQERGQPVGARSEEHSLNSSHVAISYAVFCLKKTKLTSSPNDILDVDHVLALEIGLVVT